MPENKILTVVSKQNLSSFSAYLKDYIDKTKVEIEEGVEALDSDDIDEAWGNPSAK